MVTYDDKGRRQRQGPGLTPFSETLNGQQPGGRGELSSLDPLILPLFCSIAAPTRHLLAALGQAAVPLPQHSHL